MEIYIVENKTEFSEDQVKRLQALGKLYWLEGLKDIESGICLNSNEEKILVLNPDIIGWQFSNNAIDNMPNLKAICLKSTSYSYVDLEYCGKKGIIVTNVPKYSTDSVAEYACFLMMALARKLPIQLKSNFKEEFSSKNLEKQIKDKKVGIIGLGTIGTRLAEVLTGIGMNVSYWSRNSRDNRFQYEELEELFKTADFIFPTFLINDETKKIISDDLINKMKESASIVSMVGTDCLNKELVLNKVKNNELYGFAYESSTENMNSFEGNIMITPQYAWYTKEALDNCIEIWVQSVEGAATGNVVNRVTNN